MMTGERLTPVRRLIIGGVVVVAGAAGFVTGRAVFRPAGHAPQPIAFNHQKHVEEVELACTDCHEHLESGEHAGLPALELCLGCHEEPMTESEEEAKLAGFAGAETVPEFVKLFRMPDHVYYSHRRHVAIAGLECSTCHGAIASTTTPPDTALVRITMAMCLECHEREGVAGDCSSCHR